MSLHLHSNESLTRNGKATAQSGQIRSAALRLSQCQRLGIPGTVALRLCQCQDMLGTAALRLCQCQDMPGTAALD